MLSDDYISEQGLGAVFQAVQQANADTVQDGAVLAGYIMVCEWLMPDGTYGLDYHAAGPTGGYIPRWRARAMVDEATRRLERMTDQALDQLEQQHEDDD